MPYDTNDDHHHYHYRYHHQNHHNNNHTRRTVPGPASKLVDRCPLAIARRPVISDREQLLRLTPKDDSLLWDSWGLGLGPSSKLYRA